LTGDFFAAAGFFFFVGAVAGRAFFFGSGALTLPLAEWARASSAGLFSTAVFGFLATGFSVLKVERPNTAWCGGASGFCKGRLRNERECAYRAAMRHFVFRWLVTTVGVMVAAAFITGIRYDSVAALIGAALLLGILNAFVRPILLILGAPLILLTLGIFILIINGLMLYWVPSIVSGFHVDGYGSAFCGAIVIGIISWLLSAFFRGSDGRVHVLTHHTQIKRVQGRVIEPGSEK